MALKVTAANLNAGLNTYHTTYYLIRFLFYCIITINDELYTNSLLKWSKATYVYVEEEIKTGRTQENFGSSWNPHFAEKKKET